MKRAANVKSNWMTADDLAKATELSRSTVTRHIKKFETNGLVSVRVMGGLRKVDKVAYDRACAISLDEVQALNGSARKRLREGAASPREPHALAGAQARKTKIQGDLLSDALR